jgi:uncharacterized protein YrrD
MKLARGTDLVGLPVVTFGGEDIAEVRDVLFDADVGSVLGFTLNKRGMFAGRLREHLPRQEVSAIGPHALMVASAVELSGEQRETAPAGGNVLSDRVMTDTGIQVGTVTDVVLDTRDGDVVGFEVVPADEPDQKKGRRAYLPLPETGAVSGEAVIVPASATEFLTTEFEDFDEAVDRYRNRQRGVL